MKTNRTVVGVDTAKRVFQLHWIDMETGEIVDLKLTRAKFLEHFADQALFAPFHAARIFPQRTGHPAQGQP